MITPYSLDALGRWNRGELQVQILRRGSDRPIAYCDGDDADLAELRKIAEDEGVDAPEIHRHLLKTGREIWTLAGDPEDADVDE